MAAERKLSLVFGDVTLGVHGTDFDYIFSYQTGGPESMVIDGIEWLYRTPKPTFWRATTDNDRGNKFSWKSAMWLGADQFLWNTGAEVTVDGKKESRLLAPKNNCHSREEMAEKVCICYTYTTVTVPQTEVQVSYTVSGNGSIRVEVHYHGKEGLPELPVFGMRFIMPTCADGYEYVGLSGETYPDRMAGAVKGTYQITGLPVTPYLVPQDCGVHMDTELLRVYRSTSGSNVRLPGQEERTHTLQICADGPAFAFSCLPYTAEELENATHQEELPPARRTVLCIYGAVRGVGGIDSWGSDVEDEAHHISGERDITYSFMLQLPDSSEKEILNNV